MIPGGFGARHPGAVRVGKVLRYYLDDQLGELVADVIDTYGNAHNACRLVRPGGGGPENFEIIPPAVDDSDVPLERSPDVLLVLGDGLVPHPYVLGTVYPGAIRSELTTDPGDQDGDDADYSDQSNVLDRVTMFRKIRMVFSAAGSWLLDLRQTEKPARIELADQSYLRISQEDADDHVLLATATLEHLRSIHERLDALSDAIKAHGQQIDTLSGHTHAAGGMVAGSNTVTGTSGPGPVVTGQDPTEPWDFSKSASLDSATDGDNETLRAGAVRISTRSRRDQINEG